MRDYAGLTAGRGGLTTAHLSVRTISSISFSRKRALALRNSCRKVPMSLESGTRRTSTPLFAEETASSSGGVTKMKGRSGRVSLATVRAASPSNGRAAQSEIITSGRWHWSSWRNESVASTRLIENERRARCNSVLMLVSKAELWATIKMVICFFMGCAVQVNKTADRIHCCSARCW
jgi:hypothetical protein